MPQERHSQLLLYPVPSTFPVHWDNSYLQEWSRRWEELCSTTAPSPELLPTIASAIPPRLPHHHTALQLLLWQQELLWE